MIKAKVVKREPGNHHVIWAGIITDVPRANEVITLKGGEGIYREKGIEDDTHFIVHELVWNLPDAVRILVR